MAEDIKLVKFLVNNSPWQAGETAGFKAPMAAKLVAGKYAAYVTTEAKGGIDKQAIVDATKAKKKKTQKPIK